MSFAVANCTKRVYNFIVRRNKMIDREKNYLKGDPLIAFTITYYRNEEGPCDKQDATELIIHEYDHTDTLVNCTYRALKRELCIS